MSSRILADLIIILHLLFIVFTVFGGLLTLWRPWLAMLHLPAAGWGAYIEISGNFCPLTPLENHFIRAAGDKGYTGGFIEHYLIPVIYPPALTSDIQIFLGIFVIAFNLIVYAICILRYFNNSRQSK